MKDETAGDEDGMVVINAPVRNRAWPRTLEVAEIFSLGGCIAYEVSLRVAASIGKHNRHFWRRPTIALMSPSIAEFDLDFSIVPKQYANYLANDAAGFHLPQLELIPSDSVFVFDISRDIFTGVSELESGAFIMDPHEAREHIGLTEDELSSDIIEKIFGKNLRSISAFDEDNSEFYDQWTSSIDKFVDFISSRFREVILVEIYFTDEVAGWPEGESFSPERAQKANAELERMYAHLRRNKKVKFVSVDRDKLITGVHVPWGGPSHTHFLDETLALFTHGIEDILLGVKREIPEAFRTMAFERARRHEALMKEAADVEHQRNVLVTALEASNQELTQAGREKADLADALIKQERLYEEARQAEEQLRAHASSMERSATESQTQLAVIEADHERLREIKHNLTIERTELQTALEAERALSQEAQRHFQDLSATLSDANIIIDYERTRSQEAVLRADNLAAALGEADAAMQAERGSAQETERRLLAEMAMLNATLDAERLIAQQAERQAEELAATLSEANTALMADRQTALDRVSQLERQQAARLFPRLRRIIARRTRSVRARIFKA